MRMGLAVDQVYIKAWDNADGSYSASVSDWKTRDIIAEGTGDDLEHAVGAAVLKLDLALPRYRRERDRVVEDDLPEEGIEGIASYDLDLYDSELIPRGLDHPGV